MSSDGRRVPTLGWNINSAGQMNRTGGDVVDIVDVVDIEEAPPVSSAAIKVDQPAAATDPTRPRRSTLETFNDEMAVLDRPLEGDVEYFDEKPPPRMRGKASIMFGIIAIGAASGLVFVKMRSSNGAATAAAPSAPAPASAPAAPPPSAAIAAQEPAPPAAAAPDSEEAAEASAGAPAADDSSPHATSRAAWTKVHTKTSHSRHERSGSGGKVVHRRTTTVKRHVVKRSVSSHH